MTAEKKNVFSEQAKILVKAGIFDLIEKRGQLEQQVQETTAQIQQKIAELRNMEVGIHDRRNNDS